MPTVDEVEEGMCGGGLVIALADVAEADVIDHQELRTDPALEATEAGVISEAGMEILKEVDRADVAEGDPLLAGAEADGLEDVALAGTTVAGDDDVVVALDEIQASEREDEAR